MPSRPTSAPNDTAMADPQSNKRKASVDDDLENEAPASPKRVKLDEPGADTHAEDGTAQEPKPTPGQEDEVTDTKADLPEKLKEEIPKQEQIDPSGAPLRDRSPRQSRSPTLSRRASIPTPELKQGPGPGTGADRGRKSISEQEKKRGQRLFGGLLSTLSQKPANSQQKKRLEIERRQQERAQQRRAEDDKRRVEKLARLNHARKIEQVKFDEQVVSFGGGSSVSRANGFANMIMLQMQTRHKSMLAHAHSLSTKCEPKLVGSYPLAQPSVLLRRVSSTSRGNSPKPKRTRARSKYAIQRSSSRRSWRTSNSEKRRGSES